MNIGIKIKIVALLQTFTEDERGDLERFLHKLASKDTQAHYKNLLAIIDACKPKKEAKTVVEMSIEMSPEMLKTIKNHTKNNRLLGFVEDFLLLELRKEAAFEASLALISIYEKRGVTTHQYFEKGIAEKARQLKKNPKLRLKNVQQNWLLTAQLEELKSTENTAIPENDVLGAAMQLDKMYVLYRLKYLCNLKMLSQVQQTTVQLPSEKEFLNFLNSNLETFSENLLFRLYYLVYSLLTEKDTAITDEKHDKLMQLLAKNKDIVAPIEKGEFYGYALNYGTKQINNNRSKWHKSVFELYCLLFEGNTLLKNGSIASSYFTNAIKSGLKSEGSAAVTIFLQKHQDKLPTITREHDLNYFNALMYYEQRDYEKALMTLPTSKPGKDKFYPLNFRALRLKIFFFHEKDIEVFANTVRAFEKFLHENTHDYDVSRIEKHLNTAKFIKKLYIIKQQQDSISKQTPELLNLALQELRGEIGQEVNIIDKDWLFENIDSEILKNK